MPRTVLDLDDDLLREAAERFGTTTKAATVRAALEEAVKFARRQEFIDAIKSGDLDFSEIVASTGAGRPNGSAKGAA